MKILSKIFLLLLFSANNNNNAHTLSDNSLPTFFKNTMIRPLEVIININKYTKIPLKNILYSKNKHYIIIADSTKNKINIWKKQPNQKNYKQIKSMNIETAKYNFSLYFFTVSQLLKKNKLSQVCTDKCHAKINDEYNKITETYLTEKGYEEYKNFFTVNLNNYPGYLYPII